MSRKFDTIVIGSGFGGAISACRLAEKGGKVLVLERGRRWDTKDYPREPHDAWVFDVEKPEKENGWIDLRVYDDMSIAQCAGVGGGSLIYANVFVEPKPHIFEQGWPPEITYEELRPHFATAGKMMNVHEIPDNQVTERFKLMKEGATKLGYGERFRKLPLAVTFDEAWSYDLEDPFDEKHSKTWTNPHGKEQGTCIHLGNCDLGCDVKAKNTLDLNYVAEAERHGAEVRPLHLVRRIEPENGGYRVHFERIADGRLVPGSETADRVILAAGSLGSTELLFRCRDEFHTLPAVSQFLGHNWSSNGDFLTPAFHEREIYPWQGPTISSAIDFLDGSVGNKRYFIEDGGFPNLVQNWLHAKIEAGGGDRYKPVLAALKEALDNLGALSCVMPWFAQGIDAADGRLYLGRKLWTPWKRELKLDWDVKKSEAMIDAIVDMHKRLADATGGKPWVPPTWTILKNLVTPHPLGGCNMGTSAEKGVVDHRGQVFGYENLYVLDGAIVPEAIGLNPTRTISALAERATGLMS